MTDKAEGGAHLLDSVMFRREGNAAAPSKEFTDISTNLETLFKSKNSVKLLLIGVANGQEPLSYLSVLYPLAKAKGKSLQETVDLSLVDIRPKLPPSEIIDSVSKLGTKMVFRGNEKKGSVIRESLNSDDKDPIHYRVKKPIRDFFEQVVDDPQKSHWETSVVDFVRDGDLQTYDCIFYNNVHGHIRDENKHLIIPGLLDRLAPGGLFITDTATQPEDPIQRHPNSAELMKTHHLRLLRPGVYEKTTGEQKSILARFSLRRFPRSNAGEF
jgi:hypothetical protein